MYVNVLMGLTYIPHVAFAIPHVALAGFLVFLCFRTRSKGVIFITALFIIVRVSRLIFGVVLRAYNIGRWDPGVDVRGVDLLRALEYTIIFDSINAMLYGYLCLLGVFLIYKEWRDGKFLSPPNR